MSQSIQQRVGSRIRYYRREKGYTLTEFADILNRSKSSLSKYERGETSIDIALLQEIAAKLGISVNHLIDNTDRAVQMFRQDGLSGEKTERLFGYTFGGRRKPKINRNIIYLGENSALMFADTDDETCELQSLKYKYRYEGEAQRTVSFCRLLLTNPLHKHDIIIMEFSQALTESDIFYGFLCSFSIGQYQPLAEKILLSRTAVTDEAYLEAHLRFTKEEIQSFRQRNIFQPLKME